MFRSDREWYFCHQFDNKFTPVEHVDTLTLKRYAPKGNCKDLYCVKIFSNGSLNYSSDITKLNGLPSDAWKVWFKGDESLLLIYDWKRLEKNAVKSNCQSSHE